MALNTLDDAIDDALNRLADKENAIWTRSEMALYVKDGYDQFCRRSKCLWDIYVIPNLPPVGNWGSDLEKYLAEKTAGFGVTDERLQFTAEDERGKVTGPYGSYPGGQAQPVSATRPGDRDFMDDYSNLTTSTALQVKGGTLPSGTVEVSRVSYDRRTLTGMSSQRMRELDPRYETRGGEPQWFIFDKDGLFYLRVVPAAQGNASYPTIDGSWGNYNQTDATVTEVADPNTAWGQLRERSDWFPSGGPHGIPTQVHPDALNIRVEVFRLGRDLDNYEIEVPEAYKKYIIFWSMYRALEKTGQGQDIQLSDHFKNRFEMGVKRMEAKAREMDKERSGRLGGIGKMQPFGLGEPVPPYPYGQPF
jgi:hypothetical protein